MNTRNTSKDSNTAQPQHFASPFAALTIDDGKVAIATTGEATIKTEPATVVAPALAKTPARRPIAMPARRKTPSIFGNTTNAPVEGTPLVTDSNATETTAPAQAVTGAPADAPVVGAEVAVAAPVTPTPSVTPTLSGWDTLQQHLKKGTTVRGRVTRVIKSRQDGHSIVGIKVRVAGLDGFVPFRMLGLSPLETEHSVTLEMGFRVVEMEKGKDGANDRIILNHNLVITAEKSADLIKSVKIGDAVSGVIRSIKPFGAFVDLGGASALIHVNDLPQGNIRSVKVGQQVTAQVVKIDQIKNQLGVSIKHHFVGQLTVGVEFTGLVRNCEDFGVFVQLNETVDGLVHVSQFGDFTPARGDIATVKVLATNKEKGQVQLALLDLKAASVA